MAQALRSIFEPERILQIITILKITYFEIGSTEPSSELVSGVGISKS